MNSIDEKTAQNQADTPQGQGEHLQLSKEDRCRGIALGNGELRYLWELTTRWGKEAVRAPRLAFACGQVRTGVEAFCDNDLGFSGPVVEALVVVMAARLGEIIGDDDQRWAERAIASGIVETIAEARSQMIEARCHASQAA